MHDGTFPSYILYINTAVFHLHDVQGDNLQKQKCIMAIAEMCLLINETAQGRGETAVNYSLQLQRRCKTFIYSFVMIYCANLLMFKRGQLAFTDACISE